MKPKLKVFVAEHCPGCAEALDIVETIKQKYPQAFTVDVIDISNTQSEIPERVFAIPTYMLDDKIVSLGNPKLEDVAEWADNVSTYTAKAETRTA